MTTRFHRRSTIGPAAGVAGMVALACCGRFGSRDDGASARASRMPSLEVARLAAEADLPATRSAWPIYCEILAEFGSDVPTFAPPDLVEQEAAFARWRHLVPRVVEAARVPLGKPYDAAVCYSELAAACDRRDDASAAQRYRQLQRDSYVEAPHLGDRRIHVGGLLELRGLVNLLAVAAQDACRRGAFDEAFDILDAAHDLGRQWLDRGLVIEQMIGIALVSIACEQAQPLLLRHGPDLDRVAFDRVAGSDLVFHDFLGAAATAADAGDPVEGVRNAVRELRARQLAMRAASDAVALRRATGAWPRRIDDLGASWTARGAASAEAAAIRFEGTADGAPAIHVDHAALARR